MRIFAWIAACHLVNTGATATASAHTAYFHTHTVQSVIIYLLVFICMNCALLASFPSLTTATYFFWLTFFCWFRRHRLLLLLPLSVRLTHKTIFNIFSIYMRCLSVSIPNRLSNVFYASACVRIFVSLFFPISFGRVAAFLKV